MPQAMLSLPQSSEELATVAWRHPDGTQALGSPMPRPHAEALARAFALFFPDRPYTTERIPWLQAQPGPAPRSARRRRAGSLAAL